MFRRKDGRLIDALWSAELIDLDGQKCLLSAVQDVTERKKVAEALRRSEERFVKAFRASPIRMFITTLDQGKFLEVNETYCRETGFSREELIGRTTMELGVWVDPQLRERLVAKIKKEGSCHDQEVSVRARTAMYSMCFGPPSASSWMANSAYSTPYRTSPNSDRPRIASGPWWSTPPWARS